MQRSLLSLWFFCAAVGAQVPVPVPEFGVGDVGDLACRVLAVAEDREVRLLTVEVKNSGALAAEPLTFALESKDKAGAVQREIFRRVQLPLVRRFGRPVIAGGERIYLVPTRLPLGRGAKGVRVDAASWCEGGVVAAPDLAIGAPQSVPRESLAGVFNVTEVALANPYDRDLDVLLKVRLVQPHDTVVLAGLPLAAGQRRAWILPSLPGTAPYVDEAAVACHLRAKAFEVVDWSLCAPDDPEAAAALLRPAYERCYRWPEGLQEVSGRFEFRARRQRGAEAGAYEEFAASGRYTLRRGADPVVDCDQGDVAGAGSAIAAAFQFVAWPGWEVLRQRNEFVLVTDDRVQLRGPSWHVQRGGAATAITTGGGASTVLQHDVQVAGDRIVGTGSDDVRTTWELRDGDRGRFVLRTTSASIVETFAYGACEEEFVPTSWSRTTTFGELPYAVEQLQLSAPTFAADARVAPPSPTGPGVDALRAIWDAGYRLPAAPLRIEAAFTATNPGVEQYWRGRKKVSGELTTTGFGRHMQSFHVDFDGKTAPQVEHDLAFVLRDRLLMWWLREFADRPSFDTYFAGAVIGTKQVDGSFDVDHGPVVQVATRDGFVHGFRSADGSVTRLSWQTVAGREVVQKWERDHPKQGALARAWTETMAVTWTPVGQHLLPSAIVLDRIFGREFGTETITLKKLTVKEVH